MGSSTTISTTLSSSAITSATGDQYTTTSASAELTASTIVQTLGPGGGPSAPEYTWTVQVPNDPDNASAVTTIETTLSTVLATTRDNLAISTTITLVTSLPVAGSGFGGGSPALATSSSSAASSVPIISSESSSTKTLATPSTTSFVSTTPASATLASSTSPSFATTLPPIRTKENTGAVAGAAIGCLIGGALIAALLTWFVLSRRYKKQRSSRFPEKALSTHSSSPSKDLASTPLIPIAAAAPTWEKHLPQSEADSTIQNRVQALITQVELHVDNYYRDANVELTSTLEHDLMNVNSNHLPDAIIGLLPLTRTPTLLIKHCLAALILSHISVDDDSSGSFLPSDFTALPVALGSMRTSHSGKPAFTPALSRWRTLTSYLRPNPRSDRNYITQRDTRITSAADTFTSAFAPWAKPSQPLENRRKHLIDTMKSASDTGILIFGQASGWRWVWDVPAPRAGGMGRAESRRRGEEKEMMGPDGGGGRIRIVVLPGFAKFSDEHAKALDRPVEIVGVTVGAL